MKTKSLLILLLLLLSIPILHYVFDIEFQKAIFIVCFLWLIFKIANLTYLIIQSKKKIYEYFFSTKLKNKYFFNVLYFVLLFINAFLLVKDGFDYQRLTWLVLIPSFLITINFPLILWSAIIENGEFIKFRSPYYKKLRICDIVGVAINVKGYLEIKTESDSFIYKFNQEVSLKLKNRIEELAFLGKAKDN